jgi:hypothetical protein
MHDARLLRTVLRANASFSTLCAVLLLLDAGPLAAALGVPSAAALRVLGIGLFLFAAAVFTLASRRPIPLGLALVVVVADGLWVVGTVPVLAASVLTPLGDVVAASVAAAVALFASFQMLGIRRARVALA